MSKMQSTVRARALRSIGVLALAAIMMRASAGTWLPAIGRWLAMPATVDLRRADVIVVHGGNVARRGYGIELYRRGLAPELWLTGYASGQAYTTKLMVKEGGIPQRAFRFLVTTSTWSDGKQIAAAIRARKLHSVLIVTDWWHSRRALCSTKQQLQGYDVEIIFEPSPAPAGPDNWWENAEMRSHVVDELVKLGYYALRYGMAPWGC